MLNLSGPVEAASLDSGKKQVAMLEDFFSRTHAGALFQSGNQKDLKDLRDNLQDAVIRLLADKRPYLEAEKGILWPYERFRTYRSFFEELLDTGSPVQQEEALLFLARLPFPGQWSHLIRAEEALAHRPEMAALRRFETDIVSRKIRQRGQKTYRLRRLCQILKRPRPPAEKGILRIFSLLYLFTDKNLLERLTRHYVLYVEPAAGVMYRHTWLRAFSQLPDPCLFGVAGPDDTVYINAQPGTITTELAHADFLQDDVAVDVACEKAFDLVFIGVFDEMPRKRHGRFLALLQHPKLMDATALVIGQGKAENVREFMQAVETSGLSDRVTVLANRPRMEIPGHLARCRMGVHLALHENGCRCIYEYFRSDLPCVIASYTAGINFKIFNPQTGLAAADADLADAIRSVLDHRTRFSPRHWFLSESGSVNASQRLNQLFQKLFSEWGYRWTEDIVPLGSGGANRYVDPSHYKSFRSDFQMLHDLLTRQAKFPVSLTVD